MFGFWNRKRLTAVCVTASETGQVRKDNQDSLFVDRARTVFCVADGMGGGSEGATASRFVCEEVEKALADARDLASRMRAVDAAVATANARILAYAEERGFKQMGSTVAVLLVDPADGRRAAICHVGDSRIYRIRKWSAEPLTRDHTVGGQLGELVRGVQKAGLTSRSNPLAHVLTRAVGAQRTVETEWSRVDAAGGDRFLVCSDGVHDVVSDERIGFLLSRPEPLADLSHRLSADVVSGGAPDNYSYVIIEIGGGR